MTLVILLLRLMQRVAIPAPAMRLCTKGVLVMERLEGVPMVTGLRKQFAAIAKSRGQTLEELEAEQKAKIEAGTLAKLSLVEDATQFQSFNRMLRLQRWAMTPLRMCWNWSFGVVAGRWEPAEGIGAGPGGELLSLGELLQTLADVSGAATIHAHLQSRTAAAQMPPQRLVQQRRHVQHHELDGWSPC